MTTRPGILQEMKHQEAEEPGMAIGEGTSVRLGLLLGLVILVTGGLVSTVWWAARVTTQLESIHSVLLSLESNDKSQAEAIGEMQSRVKIIETTGSPQVQVMASKQQDLADRVKYLETKGSPFLAPQIEQMKVELQKLREEFELYKAQHSNRP